MSKLLCWQCGNPSGQHKLSCTINKEVDYLQWFLDNLHTIPQEVLSYISHRVYTEILDRKLNFDGESKNEG